MDAAIPRKTPGSGDPIPPASQAADAPVEDAWTVARLLAWTRAYFERHALDSPRLCAELLLAQVLECQRLQLFTAHDRQPTPDQLAVFRANVRAAAAGKPIAYITGRKEFFSLTFEVTPDVLVPRPETELLVERVIRLVRDGELPPQARLLDLCTGSGCVAIALARQLPQAAVFASDISAAALAVAQRNAARLGVAERIEFRAGDLCIPWGDRAPLDAIVANPPYIGVDESDQLEPTVRDYEPHVALFAGADGLTVLRRLAQDAAALLTPGGHLLLEVGYAQGQAVRHLLHEADWSDIVSYRDGQRHERVLHARRATAQTPGVESLA